MMDFSFRLGHGTWYKLIHDPEGFTHFYGFISAQSIVKGCKNWLDGTRFRKYEWGKPVGDFEVRDNRMVEL